ncbi:amino acid permease [Candidatus Tokpelaia sp.]|uniref:amino acid permease n=1 Tax=Candidatus Tokpelaia sp. TaxID=2233777 RepID=UPI00123B4B53|nr:amino acid permease [Candidatus Tokpelaia sp.]KAA6404648.1 amino acid permease [Candidatus Tokpelaia sp.]
MVDKLRRKTLAQMSGQLKGKGLVPSLGWPHLVALGIGGIIGTGIYTLIGTAADKAGPAVLLAFIIAGIVCTCAAFAYAELATMIPVAGGAYTYTYTACGEILAWAVGWSTIFGFLLVASVVASGWSAYCSPYFVHLFSTLGIDLPYWALHVYGSVDAASGAHGFINLPAVVVVFIVAGFLLLGTRESALVNAVLVVLKVGALLLFAAVALCYFNSENMHPVNADGTQGFMPYGFFKEFTADGVERGVMAAAAAVFFAFYGFDTVATAAEETKNPERNLSIGIIGSLMGCILIYIFVSLAAVGAMPFTEFAHQGDVLAFVLRRLDNDWAAGIIAIIAGLALPTVILAFFYAQTRLLFTMGRDRLVPAGFAKIGESGTLIGTIIFTAVLMALIAGFFPIAKIADYANAGPLFTFAMVSVCLLILRRQYPMAPRAFKVPYVWFVGITGILGCAYLFWNLPNETRLGFLGWNILGFAVYFAYGRRKSIFARAGGRQAG